MEHSEPYFRIKHSRTLTIGTHQLSSQKGHVLNDCQSHSPFGILSQLNNSWKQRLGKLADSNHLVHAV